MRVTINFDKSIARHNEFVSAIRREADLYEGTLRLIGPLHGICKEYMSWDDAFRMAARLVFVAGKHGLSCIEGIRVYVQEDVAESRRL